MEPAAHTYVLFQPKPRWSNPVTLKMKGWGCLALLLGALLGTAWARRSQDLHCGGKGTKRKSERRRVGKTEPWESMRSRAWEKDEWKSLVIPFSFPSFSFLSPPTSLQGSGG